MTLDELAKALAEAKGPDRELNKEIALACGIKPAIIRIRMDDGSTVPKFDESGNPVELYYAYTFSLDAAETLVSGDDWFWRVGHDGEGADPSAFRAEFLTDEGPKFEAVAETPALALCLARIQYERHKAAQTEGKGA